MSRARRILLAAAALAAAAPAGAAALALAHAPGPRPHAASSAVGVAEREYRISVYRPRLRPGSYRFNVTNFGEDAHNLEVRGPHGYRSATTPDIRAHERAVLRVRLSRPGLYRLICTKPEHRRLGMQAGVRVVRGRRR